MKTLFISLVTLFCFFTSSAQTPIGGTINSDTILRKVNSPYLVTSNISIPSNVKMTIEPGVEIRIPSYFFNVYGSLIAIGTVTDSIVFTSNGSTNKNAWSGIIFSNSGSPSATGFFNYCRFSYANNAVSLYSSPLGYTIKNCLFLKNNNALAGAQNMNVPIENCTFLQNTNGIVGSNKTANNCSFINNDYGLYRTNAVNANNCLFQNNIQTAALGDNGILSGCTIEQNNTGVKPYNAAGFTIKGCSISNNTVGIELSNVQIPAQIDSSRICNNTLFNVKNTGALNVPLYRNCWCTSDSALIESKLFDELDSIKLGTLSYDIYSSDCNTFIKKIEKSPYTQTTRWTLAKSPYTFIQPYIIAKDDTLIVEPGVEVRFPHLLSLVVRGTLIAEGAPADSIVFTVQGSGTWGGIYIESAQGGNAQLKYCKFSSAVTAITENCCGTAQNNIRNSRFSSNQTAISGSAGTITQIENCMFNNNSSAAVSGSDKNILSSIFINNQNGLAQTSNINVTNSEFKYNTQTAISGGRGSILNCVIENNNIGIDGVNEGFSILKSTVSNNTIGVQLSDYDGEIAPIDSSKICNNTTYNFRNKSAKDAAVYTNCMCDEDSTQTESKIFDGNDNSAVGLISYDIFNANCSSLIKRVEKTSYYEPPTRWVLAKSPYLIPATFIVAQHDTLIIEAGVEVRFLSGAGLTISGTLIALGTVTDSITFTALSAQAKGSWNGITVSGINGGNAILNYCKVLYSTKAFNELNPGIGRSKINHSRFSSNSTAISGNTVNITLIDNCTFTNNTYALTQSNKRVNHCVFADNDYGLYQTENISVYNSSFTHHSEIALWGGRGNLFGCTIENNTIGVRALFNGFNIRNCAIQNNQTGIELNDYDGSIAAVDSTKICNNALYNVKNNSLYNATMTGNCWCGLDATQIAAKILDGKDNPDLGVVNYDITNTNCTTVVLKTTEPSLPEVLSIYPNPVSDLLHIGNIKNMNEITLLNNTGQVLNTMTDFNNGAFDLDLSLYSPGIYFIRSIDQNFNQKIYKVSIVK